jgi:hypothetical protein
MEEHFHLTLAIVAPETAADWQNFASGFFVVQFEQ